MAKITKKNYLGGIREIIKYHENSPLGVSRGLLDYYGAEYYVRIGIRTVEKKRINCFQIARIETPSELQGKGIFTKFLMDVRSITQMPFYCELVHNFRFAEALEKRGFRRVGQELDFFREF